MILETINSWYRVLGGRVMVGTALAVFFTAGEVAFADRPCEQDPAITGRTCSVVFCLSLQSDVNNKCKDPYQQLFSCNRLSTCPALEQMRLQWIACGLARDRINAVCWRGGDPGHLTQSSQVWQNVGACNARIAERCGEECPLPIPCLQSLAAGVAIDTVHTPLSASEQAVSEGALTSLLERLAIEGEIWRFLSSDDDVDPDTVSPSLVEDVGQED